MDERTCVCRGWPAVTKQPEVTARGERGVAAGIAVGSCNERSGRVLNRISLPSGIATFTAFCRFRCRPILRDLSEILLLRSIPTESSEQIDPPVSRYRT